MFGESPPRGVFGGYVNHYDADGSSHNGQLVSTDGGILAAKLRFPHRGTEWADRVEANRAVAYRIHLDVTRGRWYLTASWQIPPSKIIPIEGVRNTVASAASAPCSPE